MYFIDKSKKPKQLELYLTKPNKNRTTVGKLKHIDSRRLTVNFGKINELSFNLPYDVVINKRKAKNPNIDQIREKFFIKAKFGTHTEWFIITKISKSSNDNDSLTVQCYSLGYQLAKDRMIDYEVSSYNAFQAFTDCIKGTGWKIGYVNPELNLKHRQYNVSSKTKLDFIYEVAETLEGIPQFDTAKKEVNLYKEEEISQYKGFWITYGKYLNTITEDIDSDEVVTRLVIKGSNDLTINSVNPTGQSYIDDFSYFLYPFELDNDGKIVRSSAYMDDALALALVKYNSYVSARKGEFNTFLEDKKTKQAELTKEHNKLTDLNNEFQIILDTIQARKANGDSTTELNKQRDDKQKEIDSQKKKVKSIESHISVIDNHTLDLKNDLKIESHLNNDLLEDLANFVHREEWSDDNQIDANELYEAGLKQLSTRNSPPINIKMGIVNFFEIVEEQYNWDRLNIGDIIKIKHDKLNIWIKSRIDQLVFDFDNVNIDVTISNSKKVESLAGKINRAIYTIDKVNTDYNSRKQNWMQMAQNFNLRNDRISDIPTSPTFRDWAIKHVQNDDGSINLTVSWDYPDFNSTKKNADNIDGFWIYLYSDTDSESYYFGSKMASESAITVDSSKRSYTFPSFPANRFYTIGVRAYRSVDDDISLDGVLFSDIITPTNLPYLPSTDVNIKGKLNGVKHTVNNEPPDNPSLNDVWISTVDAKTRVWNGTDWKVNNDLNNSIEHTDKVADRITGEFENKLRDEIGLVLEDVDKAMEEVEKEVNRIETEVVPEVERVINETYIPKQPLPPDSTGSGLWWDTSFNPPRMKRKDEITGEWVALAPDANEIDEIIENMKNDITLDYKEYTDQEIQDTKTNILNELNGQIVNVKDDISSLNNRANDLLQRVSDSELELQSAGGKITKVEQNIDTINGSLSTAINQLSNIDGIVTDQQTSLSIITGELEAKATKTSVDTLTGRVSTAEGSISTIAGQVTLKANAEDVYTKTQINTELGKKVDLTVYNNKMSSLDVSINGIAGRVTNTETNINNLTGEVTSAKSQIANLDIKADGITTSVSELRSEFDGMVIDTRNLILNSSFRNGEKWGGITQFTEGPQGMKAAVLSRSGYEGTQRTVIYQTTALRNGKLLVQGGKTYTFSGWFYIDSSIPLDSTNSSIFARKFQTGSSGTYVDLFVQAIHPDYQVDKWHYFEVTESVPAGYEGNDQISIALGKNGKIAVSMLKLEEGTKANSWTPAPEDIESRVSSAETKIDQTAYDLTFKASQTSVNDLTGRMTTAESSLRIMSDEIIFKVNRDGVIAAINIQPGTVKIDAAKVDITGLVSFINSDNSTETLINGNKLVTGSITADKLNVNEIFANSAIIAQIRTGIVLTTELNASKITTGTLDALKVTVENLSASSIKTGVLDATLVQVRNLSATDITSGTLKSIDIQGVNITGSSLVSEAGGTRTEIVGGALRSSGTFSRKFGNSTAVYSAYIDSYDGALRSRITNKTVNGVKVNTQERWLTFTDKNITTQRDIHSGSVDYNGARFIDFYAEETLNSDVAGLSMHIYSGQSLTLESQYALDLKHSVDYMTNLTSGGMRVNANNTGLILKRLSAYGSTEGQSIQFKASDDTTMAIISQPNNNYNLHMYTKFGDLIILGARQEIQIRDQDGNNYRPIIASNFKRNDGYSTYVNGTGSGNTKGTGDLSGTNENGAPVLVASGVKIRSSDRNFYVATHAEGELIVTDAWGSSGGFRPIRASAFNQQSSRQYKTNIEKLGDIGLETVNSLTVVSYDLIADINNGVNNPQVGFISEDSPNISTLDGKGVDLYKISAFTTKSIQELYEELNWQKIEIDYMKQKISQLEKLIANQ